jgi:LmbE family N-acetylglucosaminyl deacetylase
MKIIIFEPHPDDLLFGAGHKIFDWIDEGHEINIITITDGRACYREIKDALDEEAKAMSEDELAQMRLREAQKAVEFLGISQKKHYLLNFHDAAGQQYVEEAIQKVKPLIGSPDIFVLPSDNNKHVDHQATHDIAINVAQELELRDLEFWVYFIPSYGKFREDSKEKQIEVKITENLRKKLLKWLKIYQSQKKLKFTWKMFNRFLNTVESRKFGIYTYEDIGKYYNF